MLDLHAVILEDLENIVCQPLSWDKLRGKTVLITGAGGMIASYLVYTCLLYTSPFNMNTFNKMWGVVTPEQARAKIAEQQAAVEGEPRNLEEQAIRLVGSDIYTKLVKGYTEKQWGRDCTQLPAFIIKRLPVRYTYDNNYFNDRYQGIPIGGYNVLIEGLIAGVEVRLGVDYDSDREAFNAMADKVVYTGMLDAFYQYRFGKLESVSYTHLRRVLCPVDRPDAAAAGDYRL